MATNKPRHGYERKHSQLKTPASGRKRWTKRDDGTGEFIDQKKTPKKFKSGRPVVYSCRPALATRPSRALGRLAQQTSGHSSIETIFLTIIPVYDTNPPSRSAE